MEKQEKPSQQQLDDWHNDPSNWKMGMFYYNKEDKRLFPPKRVKWTGWTVNFANPLSIMALVLLLLFIFGIMDIYYIRTYLINLFNR